MKFSLKSIAAAVVLAAAATGANAAIDNGANGNGELFFNIWDANGSYTRSLETSIDEFQSNLAATGSIDLSWVAEPTFTSFLAGVSNTAALKWNIVATDTKADVRVLTTYTLPEKTPTNANNVIRTAASAVTTYVNFVNTAMGANDSVAVNAASTAWAGKAAFKDTVGSFINFSNAGTLANSSFASGLGFMKIDALALGTAKSQYNEYTDGSSAVNAWIGADKTLHIAAMPVPEPESYAMLLAGLGMIGFMARRRNNRV